MNRLVTEGMVRGRAPSTMSSVGPGRGRYPRSLSQSLA